MAKHQYLDWGILGNSTDIKLIDMERIEVLRGPQGTLYGAGAMGGLVRNIPNQPKLDEFTGRIEVGYSNTARFGGNNGKVQGVVNLPIVRDKFAIRAVAYAFEDSGFYKNAAGETLLGQQIATQFGTTANIEDDIGQTETLGGRIIARLIPADGMEIVLTALSQRIEQDGWGVETITDSGVSAAGKVSANQVPHASSAASKR